MRIPLLITSPVLLLWTFSHFYFCYYSVYYKKHISTFAIVEGVISISYIGNPAYFPLKVDSGIRRFEGTRGLLPTIFPKFRFARFEPGSPTNDGFRTGIPFWLLFLIAIVSLFRRRIIDLVSKRRSRSDASLK